MTFALIEQTISGNEQATFDFGQQIGAYVYGITKFFLVNGNQGGYLQDFGISYTPVDGTGVGYTQVTLQQQIAGGLSPWTYADVAVLAFLGGTTPQDVLLGNQKGMPLGGSGNPITPLNPPAISCAVLGGFGLLFSSGTAAVYGIGAAAGMTCWPGSGATGFSPVGTAELTGPSAASGTIGVGHIIAGAGQPGIWLAAQSWNSTLSQTAAFTVPLGGPVSSAAVLLQSFYAEFNPVLSPDSYLVSLTVGADGVAVSGNTVSGSLQIDYQGLDQGVPSALEFAFGSAVVVGIT